ncbi:VOC family protein [Brevibacterium sp. RIT 803]|uniref:VOC family protein n=1 Tax=Brevibacterium sp. RIT 803 TaxID=2810210 RepID=UPI00207A7F66|nr:VOC family protein [Brevibacterium sp. RIT 803]
MTDTEMNVSDSTTSTAPVAKLAMVTLDAPDASALGDFYSAVLGWPVAYSDENYAMLTGPSNALGIGTIPDYKRPDWPDDGHKQFHLDLAADDIEAAAARCIELGAPAPIHSQAKPGWCSSIPQGTHSASLTRRTGADTSVLSHQGVRCPRGGASQSWISFSTRTM